MKIFISGITGQLGYDVVFKLVKRGYEVVGTARKKPGFLLEREIAYQSKHQNNRFVIDDAAKGQISIDFFQLELTNEVFVKNAVRKYRPDVIIHCAAWTAVDAAEDNRNREAVYSANVLATRYLAEACAEVGAKMLYLSTDYVFDGQGTRPWQPDDQSYAPLNYYGETKLLGEQAVAETLDKFFIVRIAWVFGKNGKNFIKTMLNVGKTHDSVRVVNDQIGTPTYTSDLARLLVDMIETEKYGYYHATNSEERPGEYISWYDFTKEIYRQAGLKTEVIPVTTEEYGRSKAVRPLNSRLDKGKLVEAGFTPLPSWKDALHRYLLEIGEI